jgi:hypothetical protein
MLVGLEVERNDVKEDEVSRLKQGMSRRCYIARDAIATHASAGLLRR